MKRLLAAVTVPVVLVGSFVGFSQAQFLRGNNSYTDPSADSGETENLEIIGEGLNQGDKLVNVVKGFVNRVLGLLALIALLVLLWGGFQMVTAAGNEDRYNAGFTILKQAAFGLVMIGVAWFIISLIFRVINLTGRSAEQGGVGETT